MRLRGLLNKGVWTQEFLSPGFSDGVCKEYTHFSKIVEIYEVLKKNWWKIEIERVEKSGKKVTSVLFFFLSWNKYFIEAEGYQFYINLKVF